MIFQSTRPIRGATLLGYIKGGASLISIHAPRTGRDDLSANVDGFSNDISIHAPRTGRDGCHFIRHTDLQDFNPRAPYGARPDTLSGLRGNYRISIHAPRTGRDLIDGVHCGRDDAISIHAPRTGRDTKCSSTSAVANLFQSTRPVRGATIAGMRVSSTDCISIHAPRTGRDAKDITAKTDSYISIHAPRTGRDPLILGPFVAISISIHAPRTGRDGSQVRVLYRAPKFQSTRPVRGATRS